MTLTAERLVIKQFPRLPVDPPFGPSPPPPEQWSATSSFINDKHREIFSLCGSLAVDEVVACLDSGQLGIARASLHDTYEAWISLAEEELLYNLGIESKQGRGEAIQTVIVRQFDRHKAAAADAPLYSLALLWAHDILSVLLKAFVRFSSSLPRTLQSYRHLCHACRSARIPLCPLLTVSILTCEGSCIQLSYELPILLLLHVPDLLPLLSVALLIYLFLIVKTG